MQTRRELAVILAALIGAGRVCFDARPAPADAVFLDPTAGPSASSAATGFDASRDSVPDDDLRASTAVPWSPERRVPVARPWETALRLPGRIVTWPLSVLGDAANQTMIVVEQTEIIPTIHYYVSVLPRLGGVLAPASLGDRTGFGLKARVLLPPDSKWFAAEVQGSTLHYNRTRLWMGHGPVWLEYAYDWRPRELFFGTGLESDEDDLSTYATQSQHLRLALTYASAQDRPWRARLAAWVGERELVMRTGREAPSVEQVFPTVAADLNQRHEHLVYGGRLSLDGRRGAPHWSRGARLEVQADRYDKPEEALAFRTSTTAFQFTRLEYLAEAGFSFYRDPRTVRLMLHVVDNRPDASGALLLPDLARLGGSEGLNGFEIRRFHDADMILGKLSYIFPLALRLEFDVHAEAGAIYGEVWEDARVSTLEHSLGVALRPRLDTGVLGVVGVDWSREGYRIGFYFGGVE